MLLGKNDLEKLFRRSIDNDNTKNRKKKRELRKKVERPLMVFLQYLFGDPTLTTENLDLRGKRFIYTPVNKTDNDSYETFKKIWEKLLLSEGLVDSEEETKELVVIEKKSGNSVTVKQPVPPKMDKVQEMLSGDLPKATYENRERIGISSHAQYKLYNLSYLMDDLGIKLREIDEAEYKAVTTREEQLAIEGLGRRIYRESELIKVGNSNGLVGIFRYYYHLTYNLITILPEDEESIVTIYEGYIDRSMAEEILLERKRNQEIHTATLREVKASYRRVENLLEYRKRQIDMLEKQRVALGSSIGAIEETFTESNRDIDRIINERKYLT